MVTTMQTVSATELARNLRQILDGVEFRRDSILVVRNKRPVARLLPSLSAMTAKDALSDLHGIVDDNAARDWLGDSRTGGSIAEELRDPWDT